jgi:SAM-dependent methyltransferase
MVRVKSVVDVGCGVGTWLAVFRELGVTDTAGLDGDYVDRQLLQIPQDQFTATNLSSSFRLPRTFDLAVSLEVAEHLPPQAAEGFVHSLTRLAPVVMFSAAIPFQVGTGHLNEQWPDYWAALFKQHDYLPIDCIRGKIWTNDDVEYWYAQNTLLFANAARIQDDPLLCREHEKTNPQQLAMVHPKRYLQATQPPGGVREASRLLLQALRNSAHGRMQRVLHGDDLAK